MKFFECSDDSYVNCERVQTVELVSSSSKRSFAVVFRMMDGSSSLHKCYSKEEAKKMIRDFIEYATNKPSPEV